MNSLLEENLAFAQSVEGKSVVDVEALKGLNVVSLDFAKKMDEIDPLRRFRDEFHFPISVGEEKEGRKAGEALLYFCGNSLGLQPKRTQKYLAEELTKWATRGVEGHFEGDRPWATIDELVTEMMAQVVGAADASEVAVMNSLSVNLHLMMVSFYRPEGKRTKIVIEDGAFCSDYHVVKSQISLHGLDVDSNLVALKPRQGEAYLRTEDIVKVLEEDGESIALVLLAGIQFYTGQLFDMETITKVAHTQGCKVGFDCAHAAGNVSLQLHKWNVDFACWCTYKYLNAGPGAIGGAFVHSNHRDNKEMKKLCGWWGQKLQDRFSMGSEHQTMVGAQSWQMSNPCVLPVVCLQASLELFCEAKIDNLRQKSLILTGYLEHLLDTYLDKELMTIITPRDRRSRGCQLSLLLTKHKSKPVQEALLKRGIITDVRQPNVIRVSPAPLYNNFEDVFHFVTHLVAVLKE